MMRNVLIIFVAISVMIFEARAYQAHRDKGNEAYVNAKKENHGRNDEGYERERLKQLLDRDRYNRYKNYDNAVSLNAKSGRNIFKPVSNTAFISKRMKLCLLLFILVVAFAFNEALAPHCRWDGTASVLC
uniref:Uncharacterized protein n=1 Tax=Strigamia maritima TaxID=126957 RepID=T1IK49_STRMM